MSKTCNNCGTDKKPSSVPYQVLADFKEMHKATVKKLWIALIIAWVAVLAVVGVFTYERLQYDYSGTYEEIIVETDDGGDANYIGQDGNIYNGTDSSTEDYED